MGFLGAGPRPLQRWRTTIIAVLAIVASQLHFASFAFAATQPPSLAALDEALLHDLVHEYFDHIPSTCTTAASDSATSFSFDWPGSNAGSEWYGPFVPYEEGMFQAILTHTDATGGDRSWSIRIGTGGNFYSHYAPDMHGEMMPPQRHKEAPWIDEVQQTVAVNLRLNQEGNTYNFPEYCTGDPKDATADPPHRCKKYYIHQAGAYQQDPPYTDPPFYAASLARHCEGNSCAFASWGVHAQVGDKGEYVYGGSPFTSPIMYINKYTNCDDGVLEHTQMIHNFADPNDPLTANTVSPNGISYNPVDQNYFNVGWGGIRSSSLPYALEPDPSTNIFSYADVNKVDYLNICPWGGNNIYGDRGHDSPGTEVTSVPDNHWKGSWADLTWTSGYTTFVEPRLLVNQTIEPNLPWCRDNTDPTCADPATCMVTSCTDAQIASGEFTRIQLKVAPNSSPNCEYHSLNGDLITLQCDMRDTGFGRTTPYLTAAEPCSPWRHVRFVNRNTKASLPIAQVLFWSWAPTNQKVYFSVFSTELDEAIEMVHTTFDNTGNGDELFIDVEDANFLADVPSDYDPSSLNTFTFVFGKGEEYVESVVEGRSRRRVGSTKQGVGTRDLTIFTINWFGGARLEAGSTYFNRGYYFVSELGSVSETADELATQVVIDEIELERWRPRTVDVYQSGANFAVLAAASAQGTATTCDSSATLACSGTSTPRVGNVPFFYVSCGTSTYFGPDPYSFAPSFGNRFPGHGDLNNPVRPYVCNDVEDVRPTWKLMGFFSPDDAGCAALDAATYDDTVCAGTPEPIATTTSPPSKSPTPPPTVSKNSSTSPPTPQPLPAETSPPTPRPLPAETSPPTPQPLPAETSPPTPQPLPAETSPSLSEKPAGTLPSPGGRSPSRPGAGGRSPSRPGGAPSRPRPRPQPGGPSPSPTRRPTLPSPPQPRPTRPGGRARSPSRPGGLYPSRPRVQPEGPSSSRPQPPPGETTPSQTRQRPEAEAPFLLQPGGASRAEGSPSEPPTRFPQSSPSKGTTAKLSLVVKERKKKRKKARNIKPMAKIKRNREHASDGQPCY